jgi:hypothetical protein
MVTLVPVLVANWTRLVLEARNLHGAKSPAAGLLSSKHSPVVTVFGVALAYVSGVKVTYLLEAPVTFVSK